MDVGFVFQKFVENLLYHIFGIFMGFHKIDGEINQSEEIIIEKNFIVIRIIKRIDFPQRHFFNMSFLQHQIRIFIILSQYEQNILELTKNQ